MRITGGTMKGRRLTNVKAPGIRPASDKVREAIFNILGHDLSGCSVLDLFAGTGSLGIESLSRAAEDAFFVDNSDRAIVILKKNLITCGCESFSTVIKSNLPRPGSLSRVRDIRGGNQFDLIFVDPPYGKGYVGPTIYELVKMGLLAKDGEIVIESSTNDKDPLPAVILDLRLGMTKAYGSTLISFYSSYGK